MPVSLEATPVTPQLEPPMLKRWTRAELREFINAGFTDLERYELFDGKLYDKMGKNRPHVYAVYQLVEWLRLAFPGRVTQEAPINLRSAENPTHRPEPDAAVMKRPVSAFLERDPNPDEIDLVVEVSDTTLDFDLHEKGPKYAQAGIAEYWVLDIPGRRLIVHRDPGPAGYQAILAFAEDEAATPLAAPQQHITAAALLP